MSKWLYLSGLPSGPSPVPTFLELLFQGSIQEPIDPEHFGIGEPPPLYRHSRAIDPWPGVTLPGGGLVVREDVADLLRNDTAAALASVEFVRLIDHAFLGSDQEYRKYWSNASAIFDAMPEAAAAPSAMFAVRCVIPGDRHVLGEGMRFDVRCFPRKNRTRLGNREDVLMLSTADSERFGCFYFADGYLLEPRIGEILLPHVTDCPFLVHHLIEPVASSL